MNEEFPEASFVKARLLQKVIYSEDKEPWEVLQRHCDEIRHYFWLIGQELVNNTAEGYAFLRQIRGEADQRVPKVAQRRGLSYDVTLLLVCLREEFLRQETSTNDSDRIVKTAEEITELISTYLPETANQIKDAKAIQVAIQRLVDLGFLHRLEGAEREAYEVMRIVKARITPEELNQIKERLILHASGQS
jgi:hypothetical protein